MILGGEGDGTIGANISLDFSSLPVSKALFSESSGFVMECRKGKEQELHDLFAFYELILADIGRTGGDSLIIFKKKKKAMELPIRKMREAWLSGFSEVLR